MPEVLEIVRNLIVLASLFFLAWIDYKTNLIPLYFLAVFGGLGIVLQIFTGTLTITRLFYGMFLGMIIFLVSVLTQEGIGMGDCLVFICLGMFFLADETFAIFFVSLLLVGGYATICFIKKKKTRKERIPMVPFVLAAYVILLI